MERAAVEGAVGRPAGWWRADVAPDRSAYWTKVDQPGDGRWVTAYTPVRAPWWRRPVEQTQPSPGTRVW